MNDLLKLWADTGLANFTFGQALMMVVGGLLLYLAIVRKFEPLLLLPIGFGAILANIPGGGFTEPGGLQYYIFQAGIETGVFPLLIFMGVGALTDFGALIANPKTMLLGAAAQFLVFLAPCSALFFSTCCRGSILISSRQRRLPLLAVPMAPPLSMWLRVWHRSCWGLSPLLLTPIWPWCL